jgi:hypothetical protein
MTDLYRKIFKPTKDDIIEGYEKQIEKKEAEIKGLRRRILELEGQETLS